MPPAPAPPSAATPHLRVTIYDLFWNHGSVPSGVLGRRERTNGLRVTSFACDSIIADVGLPYLPYLAAFRRVHPSTGGLPQRSPVHQNRRSSLRCLPSRNCLFFCSSFCSNCHQLTNLAFIMLHQVPRLYYDEYAGSTTTLTCLPFKIFSLSLRKLDENTRMLESVNN